ncbi:hypothetical protein DICA4_B02124 [Diutina catenulata]
MAMPRAKKERCQNCRKLKIQCDAAKPACEYCVATNKVCVYRENVGWITLEEVDPEQSSSESPWDSAFEVRPLAEGASEPSLSSFESEIVEKYARWILRSGSDQSEPAMISDWRQVIGSMITSSTMLRNVVFSYSGTRVVDDCDPEYLTRGFDAVPQVADTGLVTAENVVHIHHHSVTLFNEVLRDMQKVLHKLTVGTCTVPEAIEYMATSSYLYLIIGTHPQRMMPLVDFVQNKQDFLGFCRGLQETSSRSVALNPQLQLTLNLSPPHHYPEPQIPFFQDLNRMMQVQPNPQSVAKSLAFSIKAMDYNLCACAHDQSDVPFHRFFHHLPLALHWLVYGKNPSALALLNVHCAFALMFEFYLQRKANIWVDYMEWYRQCRGGEWFVPGEAGLYQMAVVDEHIVSNFERIYQFDPQDETALQ